MINVLYLASEAAPIISAGGLGEVAYALPKALSQLQSENSERIDIRVAIPYYKFLDLDRYQPKLISEFSIMKATDSILTRVYQIEPEPGLIYYLIDGAPISTTGNVIYAFDSTQDGEKFTYLSISALEFSRQIGWKPDIIHANDWHTSPALYWLMQNRNNDRFFKFTAGVLSLHNLPYLGEGAGPAMNAFGLTPSKDQRLPEWARNMPLPLGLLAADEIIAVSPGYAQEILSPEYGSGLHEFLNKRTESITGILNGIDLDVWNPETDLDIAENFSWKSLKRRSKNKKILQDHYQLPDDEHVPLIVMVTRFDHQKGVDLVFDALLQITDLPWQAILLGTGHPDLEATATRLESVLPDRLRALILYDKGVSRKLFAGGDILLMPSRYEPCGLTQMIAMRYGCIPVARATGGLRDTIQDYTRTADSTGFLFHSATPEALAGAIRRALYVHQLHQPWKDMQIRAMQQDFSWPRSATQYAAIYQTLCNKLRA